MSLINTEMYYIAKLHRERPCDQSEKPVMALRGRA